MSMEERYGNLRTQARDLAYRIWHCALIYTPSPAPWAVNKWHIAGPAHYHPSNQLTGCKSRHQLWGIFSLKHSFPRWMGTCAGHLWTTAEDGRKPMVWRPGCNTVSASLQMGLLAPPLWVLWATGRSECCPLPCSHRLYYESGWPR